MVEVWEDLRIPHCPFSQQVKNSRKEAACPKVGIP
jgi:hypothetical protein